MRRRLLRHTFTACSAFSLLLLVGACVLWVRSYFVADAFSFAHTTYAGPASQHDRHVFYASQGAFFLTFYRSHEVYPPAAGINLGNSETGPTLLRRAVAHPVYFPPSPPAILGIQFSPSHSISTTGPYTAETTQLTARLPYWLIVLPAAVLPSLWFRKRRATLLRRRSLNGLCLTCGYDLRATPNACPECGTLVQT